MDFWDSCMKLIGKGGPLSPCALGAFEFVSISYILYLVWLKFDFPLSILKNIDGASNQVLGWTVTIRNDSYRDRASGLASLYALPFVNDKAAQLQQLAIQNYVSSLNVATTMKNLCLNVNALFSVFFCENRMIILSTINKLYTRQGSSTVRQFCNLQDQVMTMLWLVTPH